MVALPPSTPNLQIPKSSFHSMTTKTQMSPKKAAEQVRLQDNAVAVQL